MANLDHDSIVWASQALASGTSLEYIASVLETKEKQARRLIESYRGSSARAHAEALFAAQVSEEAQEEFEEREYRKPGPKPQGQATDSTLRDRRKNLIRRRLAKNWDGIWYAFSRRMNGRTIRSIYGAESLIWATGGGIDAEIEE